MSPKFTLSTLAPAVVIVLVIVLEAGGAPAWLRWMGEAASLIALFGMLHSVQRRSDAIRTEAQATCHAVCLDTHNFMDDVDAVQAEELRNVRGEIVRVRGLLNDAIASLANSFRGLNDLSQRQAGMVREIVTRNTREVLQGEATASDFSGR